MRKTLLASAAMLATSGGLAFAQAPAAPNPLQGQYAAPLLGGPAANNNMNTFGTLVPPPPGGAVAPTPGSVVIRLNGKVYADFDVAQGTLLHSPGSTLLPGGGITTPNGYKLNPVGVASYFRLYPGIDGMTTNGLRYGAAVEIRENFEGGNNFQVTTTPVLTKNASGAVTNVTLATSYPSGTGITGTASSASGNSSAETLFVRRAFVYLGADQAGIIRVGQADGLPGIYDATGIFTIGSWDGGIGNLNNAGVQANTPSQYLLSWPFLSGNGTEYGDSKIVYLSPSLYGVDVGFEFTPNQGNILTDSSTSSPYQIGPCTVASANCINVTSGTDSSRWINRWGFGARFIEQFAGAVIQGYGVYIISGKAYNPSAVLATTTSATAGTRYDAQNFFNGGLAVSYAGFTVNTDMTYGRTNGSNALDPTGGAPMQGNLVGVSYAIGQWAVGAIGAIVNSQGSINLTGISQRHEIAGAIGGVYKIAPGLNLCIEYQYLQKHQGGFNFEANGLNGVGGVGGGYNDIKVQGLNVATIMNW